MVSENFPFQSQISHLLRVRQVSIRLSPGFLLPVFCDATTSCIGYHCTHYLLIKGPRCDINTPWLLKESPSGALFAREGEGSCAASGTPSPWDKQAHWNLPGSFPTSVREIKIPFSFLPRSLGLLPTSQNLLGNRWPLYW